MKICLIGNGLTNLVLSKCLINKKIKVDLFCKRETFKRSKIRTIGISKENLDFLDNIIDIKKISWPIKKIKIFNEKNQNDILLNFNDENNIRFSTLRNIELYNLLDRSLKKDKNFHKKILKKKSNLLSLINNKNYNLIINSDFNNEITKKFFFNKIKKNYNSIAYSTIIKHKSLENNEAIQIFSKYGPIAFLPISKTETSIVLSIFKDIEFKKINKIKELILDYNKKYKISCIQNFEKFNLQFSLSRKYQYKNILNFGDSIHKIHPLAGQGFNMTIRDIRILSNLIDARIELGLPIDSLIIEEFQNNTKHLNYLFASGIDLIHELFKFENKFGNNLSSKIIKFIGNHKIINKYSSQFANKGLFI